MSASPWLLLALASIAAGTHIITIERDFNRVLQDDQLAKHVSAITKKLKTFKIPVHPRVRLFYRLLKKSVAQFTAQHADSFFSPHKYNGDKNIQRDQEDDNDILRSSLRTDGGEKRNVLLDDETQYANEAGDGIFENEKLPENDSEMVGKGDDDERLRNGKFDVEAGSLQSGKEINEIKDLEEEGRDYSESDSLEPETIDYFYEIETKRPDEEDEIKINKKPKSSIHQSLDQQNKDKGTEIVSKVTNALNANSINKNELTQDTITTTKTPHEMSTKIDKNRTREAADDNTTENIIDTTQIAVSSTTNYDDNSDSTKQEIVKVANNKTHVEQTAEPKIFQTNSTVPDESKKYRSVDELSDPINITVTKNDRGHKTENNSKSGYRERNKDNKYKHTRLRKLRNTKIANTDVFNNQNSRRLQINPQKNIIEKMKAAYKAQHTEIE